VIWRLIVGDVLALVARGLRIAAECAERSVRPLRTAGTWVARRGITIADKR
jgi:hypothetical protein